MALGKHCIVRVVDGCCHPGGAPVPSVATVFLSKLEDSQILAPEIDSQQRSG